MRVRWFHCCSGLTASSLDQSCSVTDNTFGFNTFGARPGRTVYHQCRNGFERRQGYHRRENRQKCCGIPGIVGRRDLGDTPEGETRGPDPIVFRDSERNAGARNSLSSGVGSTSGENGRRVIALFHLACRRCIGEDERNHARLICRAFFHLLTLSVPNCRTVLVGSQLDLPSY